MQTVELLVKLKIPDVTALTAAGALRRRMGFGGVLTGLARADYYRLELAVDTAQEALALAKELAEKTNVFVNPNKHVYELRMGTEAPEDAVSGQRAGVLVTDPLDGSAEGALAALKGRLGYGERVAGLLKGVLWTLDLSCDDPQEARRLAEEIAVTRSREHGLLMNPHFQECEIR